ncbi:MAG: MlaD family protein [Bradymonadaceae bacterium]
MATRAEKSKLGLFLTATLVLLGVAIAALTGSELWEKQSTYYIEFSESVSGLQPGAPVKQRGVRVGYVDRIRVVPDNVELVEVVVKVNPGTPVKKDTTAYMASQGITGLKFIELRGGSKESKQLPPGGKIEAGTSRLRELTGRAEDISLKFESLLNNLLELTRKENREEIEKILKTAEKSTAEVGRAAEELDKLAEKTGSILEENRPLARDAIEEVQQLSGRADASLSKLNAFIDRARGKLEAVPLTETVTEFRDTNELVQQKVSAIEIEPIVEHVTVALESFRNVLERVSRMVARNQSTVETTLTNFRRISEDLKEISRTFREKPYIRLFQRKPPERTLP